MKNVLRKIGLVLAVFALVSYCNYAAPQAQLDFLRWKTSDSIVRVLSPVGAGGGTGFSMQGSSGELFIVTNRHVCEAAVNGWMAIKHGNETIFKRVVYRDNKHDICLISGDKKFPALKTSDSPYIGQINFVIGHPALRDLTVSQGEFIGYDNVELIKQAQTRDQCDGKIIELHPIQQFLYGVEFICLKSFKSLSLTTVTYPGNSGSPVFNRFGRVIGILFAGNRSQEHNNFAVPVEELKRVLKKF